jgi:hypothetical protein
MASRSFYSRKILGFRIGSGIVSAVSLVAIIWGLRLVIAHGGLQGSSLAALYAMAFGFCGLIIGVIIFGVFWSQDVAFKRMTESDRPVWARWQCNAQEAEQFIAAEAKKQQLPRPSYRSIIITGIGVALVLAFIVRTHFEWGYFFVLNGIVNGFVIAFMIYLRVLAAAKMEETIARANTEVIINEEGFLTGETVLKWRSLNWGLIEATYEAGCPDALNLVFLAGTLPGSEVIRNAQSTITVRIPVTASKAGEVRQLVATRISKQLLAA